MKWISVADKIPEDWQTVIICYKLKGRGKKKLYVSEGVFCLNRNKNYSDQFLPERYFENSRDNPFITVTHWMPLPGLPINSK